MTQTLLRLLTLITLWLVLTACSLDQTFKYQTQNKLSPPVGTRFQPGDLKFAVLADTHFYDRSLGTSGSAFQAYLDEDRKMLEQSGELFDSAITQISDASPDFVIICGDLTKDGEKISHQGVAARLARLEASGTKVYVVPGNHDIANSHAFKYEGDTKTQVDTVSAFEFRQIYNEFGFKEALYKDIHSLSYVAQPTDDTWLLALDSCKYKNNKKDHPPPSRAARCQKGRLPGWRRC